MADPPVRTLADVPWIQVVGEARDGPDAVTLVNELKPDLVFLDVVMPGLTGIEAVEGFLHDPTIVFTTAFDRYAVAAFEARALDYLHKPFGRRRLDETLSRVRAASRVESGPPILEASVRQAVDLRVRTAEAERAATRAGLAALQARMHPHFLSNALHSLAGLIGHDPKTAEEAIDRLGDLFRYALEQSEQATVSLEEEWRFATDYLAIERSVWATACSSTSTGTRPFATSPSPRLRSRSSWRTRSATVSARAGVAERSGSRHAGSMLGPRWRWPMTASAP